MYIVLKSFDEVFTSSLIFLPTLRPILPSIPIADRRAGPKLHAVEKSELFTRSRIGYQLSVLIR